MAGAENVKEEIEPVLEAYPSIIETGIKRYWKIPELYEITFCRKSQSNLDDVIEHLVTLAISGWTRGTEPTNWAAWNPVENAVLLSTKVRWAGLQVLGWEKYDDAYLQPI